MIDNKYFELLKAEILQNNPEEVKNLLKEEGFNSLSNEEKVDLLTSEDEEGSSILFMAMRNSLDSLSVLLNNKVFFGLSGDQCAEILNYSDSANNLKLLTLAVTRTPKEIHILLESRMVKKLHTEHLFEFLTKGENNEAPLIQAIKISIENMKTLLDSLAVERLDPDHLLRFLIDSDNQDPPIAIAMRDSLGYMKVFLESKAIERLESEKVFEFLCSIIDDVESTNIIWYIINKFDDKYLSTLLNSKIFDKLTSQEVGKLLSTTYERSSEEIPLHYLLKFKELPYIESFLNSTAFNKLGATEIEGQFEAHDIKYRTILDISASKMPEFLNLLLDCNNCFKILPDEEKIDVLTSRSKGLEKSPLHALLGADNAKYISTLFNSDAIITMDDTHRRDLMSRAESGDLGGTTMNQIKNNPEKLIAFITSKTFQMMDQEQKFNLIGEDLLNKVSICLLKENEQQYDMKCVGQAIFDADV